MIHRVEDPLSPGVWERISPWIAEACDVAGGWGASDVLRFIASGEMDLWLVLEDGEPAACAVTEIGEFPRLKVVNINLIGGEGVERWLELLLTTIDQFARGQGCSRVMCAYARKGWVKAAAPMGWTQRAVIIAKDL